MKNVIHSDMRNERQYAAKTILVAEDFNPCLKIIVQVLTRTYIIECVCIE